MFLGWLRIVGMNVLFIAGVCLIIAAVLDLAGFVLVPLGAALAVVGARGLRELALGENG